MPLAKHRSRNPRNLSSSGALVFAAILATPIPALPQDDLLTLRGPGSHIGATFRDVRTVSSPGPAGGAVVVGVQPKSPAATAGIRSGDLVTGFDGIGVRNSRDLNRLIGETPPGRAVSVSITRDGRVQLFKVTPILGRSLN